VFIISQNKRHSINTNFVQQFQVEELPGGEARVVARMDLSNIALGDYASREHASLVLEFFSLCSIRKDASEKLTMAPTHDDMRKADALTHDTPQDFFEKILKDLF